MSLFPDAGPLFPPADSRLAMIYDLLLPGRVLADIGTDHAYLPCRAVLAGLSPRAIAADVACGPLENAKKTVRLCALEDKVECRLSDGLTAIRSDECDEVVLAGMGGTLIADILRATPWIYSPAIHWVFQPMTHFEDVRAFLGRNGFCVRRESAVLDRSKVYTAFDAVYDPANAPPLDLFSVYFGGYAQKEDDASAAFTARQRIRLEKKRRGLQLAGADPTQIERLTAVLEDERLKRSLL